MYKVHEIDIKPKKCKFANRVTIPPEKSSTGHYSQTESNFGLKLQI